jgi:Zn-dependent protease
MASNYNIFGSQGGGYGGGGYGSGGRQFSGGSGGSGMGWGEILAFGVPAGSVFGIKIRLHIVLILFFVLNLLSNMGSMPAFIVNGLILPITLFGVVLLHELGHCYGAYIVRGGAQQIILWPLGGLAMVHGAEKSPKAEFLVTILGPAVNLLLMIPSGLLLWLMDPSTISSALEMYLYIFTKIFFQINLILFVFNMAVPIFPMDCARVVRSLMAMKMSPQKATTTTCTLGLWVAAFGLLASLFFGEQLKDTIIPTGFLFGLICFLGIFTCMQEMAKTKLGMPIYSTFEGYGGRGFYTDSPANWRKVKIWDDLKGLFGGKNKSGGQRRGGAKVVDVGGFTKQSPPKNETPRMKYLRELRELQDQLDRAVEKEDFDRASKIKQQIQSLKKQNSGS